MIQTNVLQGDGNIRYFEFVDENPYCFPLSEFRTTQAAKGVGFLPKRGLNIMKCETARALKLTAQGGMGVVEPLNFNVPRKSEAFQDDLYPPTFSGVPSHTSDEWLAGSNEAPNLMSLDPSGGGAPVVAAKKDFVAPKSAIQLQKGTVKYRAYCRCRRGLISLPGRSAAYHRARCGPCTDHGARGEARGRRHRMKPPQS